MPRKFKNQNLLLASALLFFSACANIVIPTGGPLDTQAPRLDPLHSTPNMKTNFKKQDITLVFDEWLKLVDVFNQVIVSPPLAYQPEVRLKKKSVIFEFDDREQLKEEATYVINFGTAVQDLTEGNNVPNLRFVFSTGDYIDSLSVSGQVLDAVTAQPVEKVKVMLYDILADSVVRTTLPFYFSSTDKQGNFKINNVKSDSFKVFAVTGIDYYYNNVKEQIAFLDEPILVSDTTQINLQLKLFSEEQSLKLMKEDVRTFGKVNLVFNSDPSSVRITFDDSIKQPFVEQEKDSIKIWYDANEGINWNIYIQLDTINSDTVVVKTPARENFLSSSPLKLSGKTTHDQVGVIKPGQALTLTFTHPLENIDTSRFALLEDSLLIARSPQFRIDSIYPRKMHITYKWKPSIFYKLEIWPAALTDIYGLQNDTIRLQYHVLPNVSYGSIKLSLEDLDSTQQYVVQLLTVGEQVMDEMIVTEQSTFQKTFKSLQPGQYLIKIVEDNNRNGRWDTGNYDLKRQPERLFTKKLEELRADWEVDAVIPVRAGLR